MYFKNLVVLLFATIFAIFSLTGCYNLGEFEDEESYYNAFSDFVLINDKGETITEYSMRDFYNKDAVENFVSPIKRDNCDTFVYMYFKANEDVNIGDFAIYFNSTSSNELGISIFVLNEDELPTEIYNPDGENNNNNEPLNEKIIASSSVRLNGTENDWNAVMIKNYH